MCWAREANHQAMSGKLNYLRPELIITLEAKVNIKTPHFQFAIYLAQNE